MKAALKTRVVDLSSLEKRIAELVDSVAADESHLGALSTGEQVVVAFVLDRMDWMKDASLEYMLRAVIEQFGDDDWMRAAFVVRRWRRDG